MVSGGGHRGPAPSTPVASYGRTGKGSSPLGGGSIRSPATGLSGRSGKELARPHPVGGLFVGWTPPAHGPSRRVDLSGATASTDISPGPGTESTRDDSESVATSPPFSLSFTNPPAARVEAGPSFGGRMAERPAVPLADLLLSSSPAQAPHVQPPALALTRAQQPHHLHHVGPAMPAVVAGQTAARMPIGVMLSPTTGDSHQFQSPVVSASVLSPQATSTPRPLSISWPHGASCASNSMMTAQPLGAGGTAVLSYAGGTAPVMSSMGPAAPVMGALTAATPATAAAPAVMSDGGAVMWSTAPAGLAQAQSTAWLAQGVGPALPQALPQGLQQGLQQGVSVAVPIAQPAVLHMAAHAPEHYVGAAASVAAPSGATTPAAAVVATSPQSLGATWAVAGAVEAASPCRHPGAVAAATGSSSTLSLGLATSPSSSAPPARSQGAPADVPPCPAEQGAEELEEDATSGGVSVVATPAASAASSSMQALPHTPKASEVRDDVPPSTPPKKITTYCQTPLGTPVRAASGLDAGADERSPYGKTPSPQQQQSTWPRQPSSAMSPVAVPAGAFQVLRSPVYTTFGTPDAGPGMLWSQQHGATPATAATTPYLMLSPDGHYAAGEHIQLSGGQLVRTAPHFITLSPVPCRTFGTQGTGLTPGPKGHSPSQDCFDGALHGVDRGSSSLQPTGTRPPPSDAGFN